MALRGMPLCERTGASHCIFQGAQGLAVCFALQLTALSVALREAYFGVKLANRRKSPKKWSICYRVGVQASLYEVQRVDAVLESITLFEPGSLLRLNQGRNGFCKQEGNNKKKQNRNPSGSDDLSVHVICCCVVVSRSVSEALASDHMGTEPPVSPVVSGRALLEPPREVCCVPPPQEPQPQSFAFSEAL